MSDSKTIVKYLAVFALIFALGYYLQDFDASSPTVAGFSSVEQQMGQNPFATPPTMITTGYPPCDFGYHRSAGICVPDQVDDCGGDILCGIIAFFSDVAKAIVWVFQWIGYIILYIATVIANIAIWIVSFILWIINLLISFVGSILTMAQIGITGGMPSDIAPLMLVLTIPFIALIILTVIKILRGSS